MKKFKTYYFPNKKLMLNLQYINKKAKEIKNLIFKPSINHFDRAIKIF